MPSVNEFQLSTTRFEKLFVLTNKRDIFLNSFNEWPLGEKLVWSVNPINALHDFVYLDHVRSFSSIL